MEDAASPSRRDRAALVVASLVAFARRLGRSPRVELLETPELTATAPALPVGLLGQVWRTEAPPARLPALVGETIDWFRRRGSPLRWIVAPGPGAAALAEALEQRGAIDLGETVGLALDLRPTLPAAPRAAPPLVIEPARPEDAVETLCRAHGTTPSAARFYLEAMAEAGDEESDRWRVVLARSREGPVGVAALHVAEDVAGLYSVGVVPEARRRGVATALVASLVDEARRAGARAVVCRATPPIARLYERARFCRVGTFRDVALK